MTTWYKKTYVCSLCDALVEISTKSNALQDKNCFECHGELTLLSVADATIPPTQTKEENMEATTQIDYLKVIEEKDSYIRSLEYAKENLNNSVNQYYTKEQQLRSYLADNGEEMEIFAEDIANIFDIPLTKEIEFEATVTVTGTIEVPLFGDFELEDFVQENLYVDSAHGDVCISGHSVDNVVEN